MLEQALDCSLQLRWPTEGHAGPQRWLVLLQVCGSQPQQHCCQQHRASLSGREHVQQRQQRFRTLTALCHRWWMLAVIIVDLPPGRWLIRPDTDGFNVHLLQ